MKVVPTLHPAALMRDPTLWGVVVADLVRAWEESKPVDYTVPEPDIILIENVRDIVEILESMPTDEPVAVDLEIVHGRLLCMGLCQTPPLVYVCDGPVVLEGRTHVQQWLHTHSLVFHNAYFDVAELERLGFTVPHWVCTLLLHHTVYSELPQGLAFVASVYTRIPYWKHLMKAALGEEMDK